MVVGGFVEGTVWDSVKWDTSKRAEVQRINPSEDGSKIGLMTATRCIFSQTAKIKISFSSKILSDRIFVLNLTCD